jgi:hypothetical protein
MTNFYLTSFIYYKFKSNGKKMEMKLPVHNYVRNNEE